MVLGMFQKQKIAKKFAVAGMIFSVLTVIFGAMGIFWPEAFYGCRKIPYHAHCDSSSQCITIDLESSTNCSFMALGWLTIIALVCAVQCWLMALVWVWLGGKRGALRVMKILLTVISVYEMVITPLVLLFQTVTIDELLEVFPRSVAEAFFITMGILLIIGLILDAVWLVLILIAWIMARINKKRV